MYEMLCIFIVFGLYLVHMCAVIFMFFYGCYNDLFFLSLTKSNL